MSDRPPKPPSETKPSKPAGAARPVGTLSPQAAAATALAPVPRRLDPREELDVLIRARYAIIYVVSWEEDRVERYLREIAERRKKNLFV